MRRTAGPTTRTRNRFYVPTLSRGQVRGKNAEYFLQIDGNSNEGVVLKDAEPPSSTLDPFHLRVTSAIQGAVRIRDHAVGCGRDCPNAPRCLEPFPGDRDRGLRLQAATNFLLKIALVNGASFGQKDPSNFQGVVQNGYDPNGFKTVVGRLGADLGWLVGGISGMWAHARHERLAGSRNHALSSARTAPSRP